MAHILSYSTLEYKIISILASSRRNWQIAIRNIAVSGATELSDDDSEDESVGSVDGVECEPNAETEAELQNAMDSEDVSEDDSEDSVSSDECDVSAYEYDSSGECDSDEDLNSEYLSTCSDSDYEAEESDGEDEKVCVQYSSKIRP
jgi:hypothetical protein